MAKILVSGHICMETTVKVGEFPIPYFPIDYPFYGIESSVSGVGINVAKALHTLGDEIVLFSIIGDDEEGNRVERELAKEGIENCHLHRVIENTCQSVVLYDKTGKRQIYCDLKDIQFKRIRIEKELLDCDLAVICNINFNRELLKEVKKKGIKIATDVHVLNNIHDEYNKDFLSFADIIFLSDDLITEQYEVFLKELGKCYEPDLIVLGRGEQGAVLYVPKSGRFIEQSAFLCEKVVNTVGAGDALFSSFIHYYCKGLAPEEALKRAQMFASNKIKVNGAANGFLTEQELEEKICNLC